MIGVENNLETLGTILKEARKARNLTLEKLSELTKIKLSNLEAMEEDRFQQIAAPTYAKGFLKIVARVLELPEADLQRRYEERYPQKTKQVIFFAEDPAARKPRTKSRRRRLQWAAAAAMLLCAVGLWVASWDEGNTSSLEKPAATEAVRVEGTPDATAGAFVPAAAAAPFKVRVQALADVWVRVAADEKLVFESTIPQGGTEEWEGRREMRVRVGRPSDAQLQVEGKPVDLSAHKKPVNLLITRDGAKAYD